MSTCIDCGANIPFPHPEKSEMPSMERWDVDFRQHLASHMTLRDYFAAKAMVVLIERVFSIYDQIDLAAAKAYQIADAMLAEREK